MFVEQCECLRHLGRQTLLPECLVVQNCVQHYYLPLCQQVITTWAFFVWSMNRWAVQKRLSVAWKNRIQTMLSKWCVQTLRSNFVKKMFMSSYLYMYCISICLCPNTT